MPSKIETIMTADESGAELVAFAKQKAEILAKNITRTQIRNIFSEVRQIEATWPSFEARQRLTMLKPKLSYQRARIRKGAKDFQLNLENVLSDAIDSVNKAKDDETRDCRFNRFVDLFEAILAYHRSEGGRN